VLDPRTCRLGEVAGEVNSTSDLTTRRKEEGEEREGKGIRAEIRIAPRSAHNALRATKMAESLLIDRRVLTIWELHR
jgi:hypothetical protein